MGASGRGSTTDIYPRALNAYGGTKFKIVLGYKGTNDILLAMDRGEVDIVGAYGLPGMLGHPSGLDQQRRGVAALSGGVEAQRVDAQRADVAGTGDFRRGQGGAARHRRDGRNRPLDHTGPGVPPERLAALRAAFSAMLKDPDFIAACDKRHVMLDPGSGEEMDAIVKETFSLPQPVLATIGEMLAGK